MHKKSTTKKSSTKRTPKCEADKVEFNVGMKVQTIVPREFPGIGIFPAGTVGTIIAKNRNVLTIELYENANIQLKTSEVFIVR